MRYLFAPIPVTGHVNPGLPIARELVRRGHEVRWYSTQRFKRTIESIGARWVPLRKALPLDEENFDMWPDRPAEGIAQLRFDLKNLFIEFVRGALADLEVELRREPADVIVADNASAVVEAVHQKLGIPWAVYGMSVMSMSSRDTAPFGLALPPSSSAIGRLRNKALYWLVERMIFREAHHYNAQLRRDLGLPPLRRSIFDFAKDAHLYLQSGVPSFDYPRTDLPSNVHYIGAPIPDPPHGSDAAVVVEPGVRETRGAGHAGNHQQQLRPVDPAGHPRARRAGRARSRDHRQQERGRSRHRPVAFERARAALHPIRAPDSARRCRCSRTAATARSRSPSRTACRWWRSARPRTRQRSPIA